MPSFKITFSIKEEISDEVTGFFYTMGMLGWEENLMTSIGQVSVYFPTIEHARDAESLLQNNYAISTESIEPIEDQDWNKKWRESMEPALLADSIWVSPVWLPPAGKPSDHWIKIEPKMAFGTGHHESTRLAAQELMFQKERVAKKRVLDIGTGSGVLCFTAGLFDAAHVVGFDIDPLCGENLAENQSLNPAKGDIQFLVGVLSAIKNSVLFDIIIMNMILGESAPLLPDVLKHCAKGCMLVWSGILTEQREKAITAANDHQFTLLHEKIENEWWCGSFLLN